MQKPALAIGALIFFFLCWALLHSIGQNPTVKGSSAWWYFRIIILMGVAGMFVGMSFLVDALIEGQFVAALRSLAALIMIAGPAWRYRKEWIVWLRNDEERA